MKRLERLLGMALMLSARRRLKAEDLARRFDVSLRTVYRDVRGLQEAGFPVAGAAGDGYLLPAGSLLRPLALEPGVGRGMTTERAIEPLGLVRLGEVWMVPAYCRLREDLRIFRVDRILKAAVTGERFTPRPGLSLEDFIRLKENESAPRSS